MRMKRTASGSASVALAVLLALALAPAAAETKFKRIPMQFIAALGDPGSTSGTGAQLWGIWHADPGPRGIRLENFPQLEQAGGVAPAQWKFDASDWWLEEHGLIIEKPDPHLGAGKYLVTGDREVTSVLTISPPDKDGAQRWELADGAKLYDVTHLPCRSARYAPSNGKNSCSPAKAQSTAFPVAPGAAMPAVEGCAKQDYAVLFVTAVAVEN